MTDARPKIAILIPCYNEELTVASVVREFRAQLPDADVYVYDNNSRDRTVEEARAAGAIVRRERRQGKGNVVRTMFREVDADVYVMVDGDGTYPADRVKDLVAPVLAGEADMVNGTRLHEGSREGFKVANLLGNHGFVRILNAVYQSDVTDLLSGYRAFSRRLVKGIPLLSRGFEIETELTMKVVERDFRVVEVPVTLSRRPEGSHSKIAIFRDGTRILSTILALARDYKPLTIFGSAGLLLVAAGLVPGVVVILEFARTRYITHVPLAILAVATVGSGLGLVFTGFILHAIARRFQETERQLSALYDAIVERDRERDRGERDRER